MTTAKLESRRTVHKGRIFTVDVDRVHLPSGFTTEMDIVRHPGSVVLLPMPSADQIVLIKQYRYSIDQWIWELPAGTLNPSEDPAAGAARECEEEIGLVPGRVDRVGAFYPTPGFCDEIMIFFRCTELHQPAGDSTVQKDEDEDLEPRTFTLEEARALIRSGQIVDLKTVAGLGLLSSNVA